MWDTKLTVIKPGLQTFIVDHGRSDHLSLGVPMGGAMDKRSMIIANRLVGNQDHSPIIEATLVGPKLKIVGDAYISVAGGNVDFKIDDIPAKMYETIHVKSGSTVSLGHVNQGVRSYLAINGNWQLHKWLDSYSQLPAVNLKSLQKNILLKNSELNINTQKLVHKKVCPFKLRFQQDNIIRILSGPEYNMLTTGAKVMLAHQEFTIHKNSNRMAVSVEEKLPVPKKQIDLISSANLLGTIQLTKQGQPLILMNDAGTTGGYPRIANVITNDLQKIAQVSAGQKVRFKIVNLDFAYKELKKEKELLLSL